MDSLNDFLFISVPESLFQPIADLGLPPTLLLPIENEWGDDREALIAHLSWERILAAMLNVMALDPHHPDIDAYRSVLHAVKPNLTRELTQAAFAKRALNDFDFAENVFYRLTLFEPDNPVSALNLALLYDDRAMLYLKSANEPLSAQYTQRAKAAFDALLAMPGLPLPAYYDAGLFYARTGENDQALRCLRTFIDHAPDEKREKIESALTVLKLIETEIQTGETFSQATRLIADGQTEAGLSLINRFLEEEPSAWNGWFLKGWAHRKQGAFREAAEAFETALRLKADNPEIYNELAICRMELRQWDRAVADLEQALALDPQNTKLLSNRAILALKMQQPEQAAALFREVLQLNPDDAIAKRFLDLS